MSNVAEPKFNRVTQLVLYIPPSIDPAELSYEVAFTKFSYTTQGGKTEPEKTEKFTSDKFLAISKLNKLGYKAYRTYEYNLLTYFQNMQVHNDNHKNRGGRVTYKIFQTKNGKKSLIKTLTANWFFQYEEKWSEYQLYGFDGVASTPKQNPKITKNAVVFFIGGAGDKEAYYIEGPNRFVRDLLRLFNEEKDKQLKSISNNIICDENKTYLDYEEARGYWDIKRIKEKIPSKNDLVYIIGHSLGGWNGAHLAEILKEDGYHIEMLITLDPVGTTNLVQAFSDIYRTPPKVTVKNWINFYCEPDPQNRDDSDDIADKGGQWRPKNAKYDITTKINHWDAVEIMLTPVVNGKNGMDLLIQSIKDNLK